MSNPALLPGVSIGFGDALTLVGQQLTSKLAPVVNANRAYSDKGDRYTYETFGKSTPTLLKSELSDTAPGKVAQFRRVGFFQIHTDAKIVTSKERAEKLVDPTDAYVRSMAAGKERLCDRRIVQDGILALTQQDEDENEQVTQTAFPTANIIAVNDVTYYRGKSDGKTAPSTPGAGEGLRLLTPAKLRKARKLLADGEDEYTGMPVCLYEQQDLQNLLTSEELINQDYNTLHRLEAGEIDSWMGIRFVKVDPGVLPNVPGSSTSFRTALFYPEYIMYKEQMLVPPRIDQRPDLNFNYQAYYKMRTSVMRARDTAVVWIDMER